MKLEILLCVLESRFVGEPWTPQSSIAPSCPGLIFLLSIHLVPRASLSWGFSVSERFNNAWMGMLGWAYLKGH
jgi:hypothetical protein